MQDTKLLKQTPLKTLSIRTKLIAGSILILILAGAVSGCYKAPEKFLINLQGNSQNYWETISKEFPLPENFSISSNPYGEELLPEIRINHYLPPKIIIDEESILLNYEYLIPVTDFWNPVNSIPRENPDNYKLVTMKQISLPEKGLAVEGLYPGDSGYPLYEETRISLVFPEGSNSGNTEYVILTEWFNNIRKRYKEKHSVSPQISWINGVGDLMLQRGVEDILIYRSEGASTIFGDTEEILKSSALTLGNLEGSVTYTNIKTPKSYNFKFNPRVLTVLKNVGFDYFSITNNHIYDYGETGFTDTLRYLIKAGIPTSGAGLTKEEAARYTEFNLDTTTVRILSMGAYPREKNGWDGRSMAQVSDTRPGILFEGNEALEAVREMTSPDSFDILMVHGGVEWTSTPTEKQKRIYRSYIEAGIDLILGSHPHVLQGMEVWKKGLIAYSLGNFVFPGMGSMPFAEDSMILSAGIINNKIVYLKPIPVKIDNQNISLDKSGKILERFTDLTKNLIMN
ncbi:MAG: CapA family protein [Spirochaetales bacterium]|nr:CapA family protein [Spirochaetales bacterium]